MMGKVEYITLTVLKAAHKFIYSEITLFCNYLFIFVLLL